MPNHSQGTLSRPVDKLQHLMSDFLVRNQHQTTHDQSLHNATQPPPSSAFPSIDSAVRPRPPSRASIIQFPRALLLDHPLPPVPEGFLSRLHGSPKRAFHREVVSYGLHLWVVIVEGRQFDGRGVVPLSAFGSPAAIPNFYLHCSKHHHLRSRALFGGGGFCRATSRPCTKGNQVPKRP